MEHCKRQEQLLLAEQERDNQDNQQQVEQDQSTTSSTRLARLATLFTRSPPRMAERAGGGGNGVPKGDSVDANGGEMKQMAGGGKTTVMKMSRNGKNNHTNQETTNGRHQQLHNTNGNAAGRRGGDSDTESNSKTPKRSCCSRFKWPLICLMGLTLILASVLVLFNVQILDNGDQCLQLNSPFQQTKTNKLFATKTLYTTTLNYLSKSPLVITNGNPLALAYSSSASNQVPSNPSSSSSTPFKPAEDIYDKSSISIPKIFSQTETLESIHQRLTSPRGNCTHAQLYFVGRHAARLPSSEQISRISQIISGIQARIDLPKRQQSSSATSDGTVSEEQQQPVITSAAPPTLGEINNSTETQIVCSDPLIKFKQWQFFADAEQGNLITETGGLETLALAQRLKSLYPEKFDASLTNITFGNTEDIRTVQTAVIFLKQLENFSRPGLCDASQYPTEGVSDRAKSAAIRTDACLSKFSETFRNDNKLHFHDSCDKQAQGTKIIDLNLNDTNRVQFIVESVSKRLKLDGEKKLTAEETRAMYDVCRYESALTGSTSIWCLPFSERDIKFYEFLSDIKDYFESAYGNDRLHQSSCPITLDIYNSFNIHEKKKSKNREAKPQALFLFTHSEVIQRLIAASVDLTNEKNDPEYLTQNLLKHLDRGTAPKDRQWQTSLFTPFSANLAFSLYDCPSANDNSDTVDLDDSGFKVVASLNEQPILLEGCKSIECPLPVFSRHARISKQSTCDMPEICKRPKLEVK